MKYAILVLLFVTTSVLAVQPTFTNSYNPTLCQVYYSPKGGVTDAIVNLIGLATKTIKVQAYSFTSQPIAQALIDAGARGVTVELIVDSSQWTKNIDLVETITMNKNISVWKDDNHRIAHNKIIIVDQQYLEQGSFNYSAAAETSNAENAVICKTTKGSALFTENFELHKSHSVKQ